MTMHTKNRILQVKQSTSFSKRNIISKYFSANHSKSSGADNEVSETNKNNSITTPRSRDASEVVVISDSDEEDLQKKIVCKFNLKKSPDKNEGKVTNSGINLASQFLSSRTPTKRPKTVCTTRNLFSSMDMYFSDIENKDVNSGAEQIRPQSPPAKNGLLKRDDHRNCSSSKSNVIKRNSPFKRKAEDCPQFGTPKKQSTLEQFLSPRKKQKLNEKRVSSSPSTSATSFSSSPTQEKSPCVIIDLTEDSSNGKSSLKPYYSPLTKNLIAKNRLSTSLSSSSSITREAASSSAFQKTICEGESNCKSPRIDEVNPDIDEMYNFFSNSRSVSRKSPEIGSDELDLPVFSLKHRRISTLSDSADKPEQQKIICKNEDSCHVEANKKPTSFLGESSGSSSSSSPGYETNTEKLRVKVETRSDSEIEDSQGEKIKEEEFSNTKKLLGRLTSECAPITPRKIKRSKNCASFLSPNSEDENQVAKKPVQTNQKMTYTLNKLVKDKKEENEELKNMEVKLMEDLKKGGFGRVLDCFDSEDDLDDNSEGRMYKHLTRIISSTDDCLGIQECKQSLSLFSKRKVFSCFCCHTIAGDERISAWLPTGLDLRHRLLYLENNMDLILEIASRRSQESGSQTNVASHLGTWLVQILSCHSDPLVLNIAQQCIASLILRSNQAPAITTTFYHAFCNLGIKKQFVHETSNFIENSCSKCTKRKKMFKFHPSNIDHLIQAFLKINAKNPNMNEMDLYYLLTTALMFLTALDDKPSFSTLLLYQFLEALLNRSKNLNNMLSKTSKYVLHHIQDVNTLHCLITTLSGATEPMKMLRRFLAYSVLARLFDADRSESENDVTNDLSVDCILKFASLLSVKVVRSSLEKNDKQASNRDVYIALWSYVSLIHVYNESFRTEQAYKKHLRTLTESFRVLNASIRDNGYLYCSEAKYFIRLTTALAEFQLQSMPKSQLYQQGIFKYLREARVSEEIVEDEFDDETDYAVHSSSEDDSFDHGCATVALVDRNYDDYKIQLATSSNCYVSLIDCESLLRRNDRVMDDDNDLSCKWTVTKIGAHQDRDFNLAGNSDSNPGINDHISLDNVSNQEQLDNFVASSNFDSEANTIKDLFPITYCNPKLISEPNMQIDVPSYPAHRPILPEVSLIMDKLLNEVSLLNADTDSKFHTGNVSKNVDDNNVEKQPQTIPASIELDLDRKSLPLSTKPNLIQALVPYDDQVFLNSISSFKIDQSSCEIKSNCSFNVSKHFPSSATQHSSPTTETLSSCVNSVDLQPSRDLVLLSDKTALKCSNMGRSFSFPESQLQVGQRISKSVLCDYADKSLLFHSKLAVHVNGSVP